MEPERDQRLSSSSNRQMGMHLAQQTQVPKTVMNYVERKVDVPSVLQEERAVEIPQHMVVETITQVPKPVYQDVRREVPAVTIKAVEKIVEIDVPLRQEKPIEVPQVQYAHLERQVLKPQLEYVEKPVPVYETQEVEKVVEIPQVLIEEQIVEVPQVQVTEVVREELQPVVKEVIKEVPKALYVEKVVEVQSQLMQEEKQSDKVPPQSTGIHRGYRTRDVFAHEDRFRQLESAVPSPGTIASVASSGPTSLGLEPVSAGAASHQWRPAGFPAMMTYTAAMSNPLSAAAQPQTLFDKLDTNHDGVLTRQDRSLCCEFIVRAVLAVRTGHMEQT